MTINYNIADLLALAGGNAAITVKTEIDAWLEVAWTVILEKLDNGPVMPQ